MNPPYFKLLCIATLFTWQLNAQEIKLNPKQISQFGMNSDMVSMSPVFKLNTSTISNRSISKSIGQIPFQGENVGYFFLIFNGIDNGKFKNEIAVIIEDYTSESLRIIADMNGNLDFTDDGEVIEWNEKLLLPIPNPSSPKKKFWYQLRRSRITPENAPRLEKRYATQFSSNEIAPAQFWVTNQRLNLKVSHSKLDDKLITILILDKDLDGLHSFNPEERGDRLAIVESHLDLSNDMMDYLRVSEPIDHNAVFNLYGSKYQFVELSDQLITIKKTNRDTKFFYKKGMDISSYNVKLLNKQSIEINKYLDQNKYLLIDVGGTWCGGCVAQEPIIKQLFDDDKINVIGIFALDTKERVQRYVSRHKLEWPIALMSEDFKSFFRISSYPTYILISPSGKIEFMDMTAENIQEFLEKT